MSLERFGKYLLLEKLAAGGMAEVYLAKTIGYNNFVAIKRVLPQFSSNPNFLKMFKDEAKIAANLRHSNIVSIHFFGEEKGQLYLVMEFVEGQNLRQLITTLQKLGKTLPLEHILYIIREVAAGLDYANRALDQATGKPLNIIHRDMSPQNIMISFEGEVKIVDFGIAKAESQVEITQAGTIKGKFSYMSPEQTEGEELDTRSDIFSLGVIFWELVTGERLFTADNNAAILKKVKECQITSARKINPNLPLEVERILEKCLAKKRENRYESAGILHRDLSRFLNTAFPEFTQSDLSKFMKSIFRDLFLEYRKKLSSYSQIEAKPNEVTKTVTQTESESHIVSSEEENIPGLEIIKENQVQKIGSLRVDEGSKKVQMYNRKPNSQPPVTSTTQLAQITPIKRSVEVNRTTSNKSYSISIGPILLIVVSIGLVWFYFNPKMIPPNLTDRIYKPQQEKKISASPATPSSKEELFLPPSKPPRDDPELGKAPISILSDPMQAFVEINGKQVGLTPYRGHVPIGIKSRITVRKDRFIAFDATVNPTSAEPLRLEAKLQPKPSLGYITIQVVGASTDTFVEVNGTRLTDRSQWNGYPVPAGVPISIKAYSPYRGLQGETQVSVTMGEKKKVPILMKRVSKQQP